MSQTQPHVEEVLARALGVFAARFGRRAAWAAAAPGRVNLIGEHTDYNCGFVLPIAIDRVCVAVGAEAGDAGVSRVYAADLDSESSLDFRGPLVVAKAGEVVPGGVMLGSPLSYVAGVVAEFQRLGRGVLRNLDIAVASSVPIGSGLSSSASLEVAVATLLEEATRERLKPQEKALLCQRAEHEFAGVPCGIMDQFISVMGRADHALLIDCRSQEAEPIPMPGADRLAVVVMDTRVRHSLAAGEYARRRAECAAAAKKLGVRDLRDAKQAMLASAGLSKVEARRAGHVMTENGRTLAAAEALRQGDLAEMGRLMVESHRSLRDDFEVSCNELDTLVDVATGCPGVYGARMTGGGFGGCAIAIAEPNASQATCGVVEEAYRAEYGRDAGLWLVHAAAGASGISLSPRDP